MIEQKENLDANTCRILVTLNLQHSGQPFSTYQFKTPDWAGTSKDQLINRFANMAASYAKKNGLTALSAKTFFDNVDDGTLSKYTFTRDTVLGGQHNVHIDYDEHANVLRYKHILLTLNDSNQNLTGLYKLKVPIYIETTADLHNCLRRMRNLYLGAEDDGMDPIYRVEPGTPIADSHNMLKSYEDLLKSYSSRIPGAYLGFIHVDDLLTQLCRDAYNKIFSCSEKTALFDN